MTDDLARIVRAAVDAALDDRLPPPPEPTPLPDPPPEPHPHRVKVRAGQAVPVDCPDCTRGLRSRGDDLVCMSLPADVLVKGAGGIVACGVPIDG